MCKRLLERRSVEAARQKESEMRNTFVSEPKAINPLGVPQSSFSTPSQTEVLVRGERSIADTDVKVIVRLFTPDLIQEFTDSWAGE